MKTRFIKKIRKNTTHLKNTKKYRKNRIKIIKTKIYEPRNTVSMFLQMLSTIKLFHWKTHSFSQHKATDELYTKLNANIDTFVEIMLGTKIETPRITGEITLVLMDHKTPNELKGEIEQFKQFLINMSSSHFNDNSDLLNIRDEILGNLNQFNYLLTFE